MFVTNLQPQDIDVSVSALRGALRRTWCAFCGASSIHGLKYTRDKETNRCIRFTWILITLIMFFFATAMIITFYLEYRSNLTVMNVDSDNTPISTLLFPSTIVCPEEMYDLEKSIRFFQKLIMPNSTSLAEIKGLLYYLYAFINSNVKLNDTKLNLLEEVMTLNKLSILDYINNVTWSCADLLFRCRFQGEILPCGEIFDDFYTFKGHCCSFRLKQDLNTIKRNADAGLRSGLSIVLYYNDREYVKRLAHSRGFQIFIKEIGTFASSHTSPNFVPLNEEVFITITPTQTFCSQAVKDLPFENRLCVFPQEKKLKYFDMYLGSNCEINCRIERMLKFCNCYLFVFYQKRINERVCSFKDLRCLEKNYVPIIGHFMKTKCTCYRNCEKMDYDVKMTSAPLRLDAPTIDSFYDDLRTGDSVVHIGLSSQVYRRVRLHLYTNMITLVSNLGSAFSLFVGVSMISAIEIIYYFSVILNKFYRQECQARIMLLQQQRKANERTTKPLRENKIRKKKNYKVKSRVQESK